MEMTKKLLIRNELGLHARAAAKIVALASRYSSLLSIKKDDHEVEGTSILSILSLACPKGTEVLAKAVGEDSEALIEALSQLFEQKFGEAR
ncbi:MAG: HPr family phosphocarrier protein [Deltaproteobacteria bacterium]|nr:HPr family phosphocarrier protein [Deltaproteobacteria bacterium]